MKTFEDLEFRPKNYTSGTRARMNCENGFGVSVITGEFAYSDDEHPYELAVLHNDELCYSTGITDDVIGHLDAEGVTETMRQVQELPRRGTK